MEQLEAKRMLAGIQNGHITGLIFSKLAWLARNKKIRGIENKIRKAVFGFDRKLVQPAGRSFDSAGNDIFYKEPTRTKRRKVTKTRRLGF